MFDFFALRSAECPWGDYGDILWHGLVEGAGPSFEKPIVTVSRTGPYVPPVTQPFSEIIVDNNLRRQLEDMRFTGFVFAPVNFDKLVRIDWQMCDSDSDEPRFYPESGKPEDYILSGKNDPLLEREMPTLWDLVIPSIIGLQVEGSRTFRLNLHPNTDITREGFQCWVSSRMKSLLEASAGSWVSFTKVRPV